VIKHTKNLLPRTLFSIASSLLIFALGGQTVLLAFGDKTPKAKTVSSKESAETLLNETSIVPAADFGLFNQNQTKEVNNLVPQVGTNLGSESEPNDTSATADTLTGAEGKIRGLLWNSGPALVSDGNDTDFYVFTTTAPNSKIYASTQTQTSSFNSFDTTLAVLAADGTTVLETDLNDGSLGASAASIAGTLLPMAGTYYLRVTNVSATTPVTPYYLYFAVKNATPTAETEPNNNGGTPNPIPASGLMSGTINPAADSDTFSIALNAGDTIFASLDIDPERDNVQWNGRLGIGLFGTPSNFLVINDTSVGSAANPLSEATFMTVLTSGTYVIYVDEPAGGGSATSTYNLNVTVIPQQALSCSTVTNSTSTPIADAALTSSTINIPGSPIIRKVRVFMDISHPLTTDLDVHLVSPANNDNGLFSDITTIATQAPPNNFVIGLDDDAAVPLGTYQVNKGIIYQPEASNRLDWFNGENAGGNWRLDIRDDTATNTGTLNSWSLEVCTDPAPVGNLIYNENFEAGNGGYTHSGTLDEWEYGTPATVAAAGIAPFTTCASGTNCWKTDLDGTYELSSSQDLTSPNLNLTNYQGNIRLYWQQRYSMENINFDRIWVRVTEVGNPTNTRIVWLYDGPTMNETVGGPTTTNIGESAGWGRYSADISDFAGKNVQVQFHLDSDTSVVLSGWAIDDVQLYHVGVVAANVGVGGRVVDSKGNAISRAYVTLTGADGVARTARTNTFGYYRFDNIEVGDSYILEATAKGYAFAPRVVTVQDEVADADIIAIE
jgi:subtilisin-like proprotein convertase family protein